MSQEPETCRKIFVGRLNESITASDLREYFTGYGQVIDVYIPKPFRAFGFVTFVDADVVQTLFGEHHVINGTSIHVSKADPKEADNSNNRTPEYGRDNYQSNHNKYRNDNNNYRYQYGQSSGGNMNRNRMRYNEGHYNQRDNFDNDNYNNYNRCQEPRYYDRRLSNEQHNGQKSFINNGPLPPMKVNDPMNAMMNMINPMMAAFLQQISNGFIKVFIKV